MILKLVQQTNSCRYISRCSIKIKLLVVLLNQLIVILFERFKSRQKQLICSQYQNSKNQNNSNFGSYFAELRSPRGCATRIRNHVEMEGPFLALLCTVVTSDGFTLYVQLKIDLIQFSQTTFMFRNWFILFYQERV